MKKVYFLLFPLLCSTIFSFGQEAEDIIILNIKTNYKVFYGGEKLFEQHCATCHGINEASISVALSDVHTKRSRAWILELLMRPQTLEYSEDEETKKYKEEYGSVNHQLIRDVNEQDYNDILDFLQSELDGPLYDESKLREEYFVLQKNDLIKVGDYKYYFPDGKLSHFYIYNNGLPWEVMEVFDVFGEKKDGGTLKNGTGTITAYDDYGNKESITTYVKGFRSGEYKQYFDGGQIELMGYYTNGKANGRWTYYYPSGEVKNYIHYRNGRITSNREGDRPDYHPGVAVKTNYTSETKTTYVAPNVMPASTNEVAIPATIETIIYPYNKKVDWDNSQLSNKEYTGLGNDLFSKIILGKNQEIYTNASVNFKKYHSASVMESYVNELRGYGEFEFYRMDKIGFTTVGGRKLVLMDYLLSFPGRKIKMYISYVSEAGTFKLDGWSYEASFE